MDVGRLRPAQSNQLEGVKHQTAQERVAEILRRAILSGTFAPGAPLVLSDLSKQLGVSRTPIREAMHALAADGMIDMDSFRSATVHMPTPEEAHEIYDLRLVLEPMAVRLAIEEITDAELDASEAAHRLMLGITDHGEWVEKNREFHSILLEPAKSRRLISIIRSLRNAAVLQVALSLQAERAQIARSNIEHEGILLAFRERDVEKATELTRQHLRTTLELVERYVQRSD